ncbi:hypothetical protein ACRAWG_31365 [Methylobacterium sp. P31]
MSKGPLAKGFKRARDINSTYSLLDRIFQIIGALFPGALAGGLAGWALSKVDWFWTQYGVVGVVLSSIALGAVLIALQLTAEFKLLGSTTGAQQATTDNVDLAEQSAPPTPPRPLAPSPIARSAIVVAGTTNWPPQYRLEFAKNGRDAEVYLRFNTYASGIGRSGWTTPVTVKLRNIDRYIQGESISIPIVYAVDTPEGKRWAFGCEPDLTERSFPRYMLGPNRHYRGGIMLVGPDELVEWCFFIAEAKAMDEMPQVLGEHMWAHIYEWTGYEAPNRNPERLFR